MRNFSDIFYICQIRYPSTLNCILIRASSMRWWSCNLCQSCNLTAKGYCNKKFGGATIAQWILPPLVRVPSTPSMLLSFIVKFVLYLSCEKAKINKKRPGLAHFKNTRFAFYYQSKLHIGVWSSGHRAPTITVRILLKFTVYNLQKYIRKE